MNDTLDHRRRFYTKLDLFLNKLFFRVAEWLVASTLLYYVCDNPETFLQLARHLIRVSSRNSLLGHSINVGTCYLV